MRSRQEGLTSIIITLLFHIVAISFFSIGPTAAIGMRVITTLERETAKSSCGALGAERRARMVAPKSAIDLG